MFFSVGLGEIDRDRWWTERVRETGRVRERRRMRMREYICTYTQKEREREIKKRRKDLF